MSRRSAPSPSMWVAKVWRRVWGVTRRSIPAARARLLTMRCTPAWRAAPARIDEEGPATFPRTPEPRLDRREGSVTHRHHPLLAALAHDADRSLPSVHVGQVEAAALRDAEAGGIEQLEQGPVSESGRRAVHLGVEEVLRFVLGQERRQSPGQLGAPDLTGGIELDRPTAGEVLEAAPHRGELAGDGGSRQLPFVERGQPAPDGAGVGRGEAAHLLAGEEGVEVGEIGGIASQGVSGGAALVVEVAEELTRWILHDEWLTPPRERPLPGSRTRRGCTGASACRRWPRAP